MSERVSVFCISIIFQPREGGLYTIYPIDVVSTGAWYISIYNPTAREGEREREGDLVSSERR